MPRSSRASAIALVLFAGCSPWSVPLPECKVVRRDATSMEGTCDSWRVTVAELKSPYNEATIAEQLALWDHQFSGGLRKPTRNFVVKPDFSGLERESHDGRWRGEMRVLRGKDGARVVTCGGTTGQGRYRCSDLLDELESGGVNAITAAHRRM